MANITKRGNTFRIRVFIGCDMNGKQLVKSTTFTPPVGVTEKKAEKLAQEYAFEFERHCKGYSLLNENMRFSELADWYFTNYAPQELKRALSTPIGGSTRTTLSLFSVTSKSRTSTLPG